MDSSVQVELLKQSGALIQTLIWVGLVAFVFHRFRDEIRGFASRVSQLSLKTPAGEISATAVAQAGALLGAAEAAKSDEGSSVADKSARVQAVSQTIETAAAAASRLKNRSVLWVDDHPANNVFEIRTLETLGIRVETAMETAEALRKLSEKRFDLVITDLTRNNNPQAGLDFIERARQAFPRVKIIVYSTRRGDNRLPKAYEQGVVGAAYVPTELINRVIELLG